MGRVLACCSCCPIVGTGASRRPVDNADVSGDGCPALLSPRTVSPSLELTSGEWLCTAPSVRCCHVGVLLRLPRLVLRHLRVVTSAHAGFPLTNDGLHTMERSSCHVVSYLSPPQGSDEAIFSCEGRTRRKSSVRVGQGGNLLAGSA